MSLRTEDNQIDEKFFHDLVHQSPAGIFLIQNNNIIYINSRSKEICEDCFGLPGEQAHDRIHPDDAGKLTNAYQSVLTGNCESAELEFRLYPSSRENDDDFRWILFLARAVMHKGQPAILINIVDHSKTRESVAISNLVSRMSFFDHIASGLAHEIRNPLTAINSNTFTLENLLGRNPLEPGDIQLMQTIIAQIEGASNKIELVMNKLMAIARIEQPKMALMDANESLKEVMDFFSDTLRQNGITPELSLDDGLPKCYADSRLIQQAIINLIHNACEAMEQSDRTKKIRLKSFSKDDKIFISIADSGPGLPQDIEQQVFDPLLTLDFASPGVGLKVLQKIITLHQGSIHAAASEWGGSEFILELPIEKRAIRR